MKILVLGSAAGGGFPQWNCNCPNCDGLRKGTIRATPRTQSSIAVSSNDKDWILINASPDILTQIRCSPVLQPARAVRDTGIAAVVLMDAQLDHITGLLMLREGKPMPLYCTPSVWQDLAHGLRLDEVLSHYCGLRWHALEAQSDPTAPGVALPESEGIRFVPLELQSKPPPYSAHRTQPRADDNIGLLIEDTATHKKVFYAPGLLNIAPHIEAAMRMADCVLVDGTLWTDDEMIRLGLGHKTGAEMGHLAQSGSGGMLDVLDTLGNRRKILIHINNSNPILNEDSPQASILREHQIEVAFDGMEIRL